MQKKLTLWFIIITIVLDASAFGIIMPVMPSLIENLSDASISEAARIGGYLMFAFGITQFICGPLIGNLSDAFGRKPVLMISLIGMVIDYIIMALAPSIAWLLLGRILGGMTTATHATAGAVITDISDEDEKAVNFGLIGAAFGFGFILGPMIGGVLSIFGTHAPFWGAAVISAMNLIFGFFVFKETLPKPDRRKFQLKRANPIGSFIVLKGKPALWAFIAISFFYNFAFSVYPSIWAFFTTYRFGFEPWMIAATLGLFGLSMVFSQAMLIRPLMRVLGARKIVHYGLLLEAIVFSALAIAMQWYWLLIILPISAIAGITGPAFQDLVTRLVSKSEQGELQGILASVLSLTGLTGTVIMSQSFAYFTDSERAFIFDGAPFVISAISVFIAWIIYQFVTHNDEVEAKLDASSDRQLRKK